MPAAKKKAPAKKPAAAKPEPKPEPKVDKTQDKEIAALKARVHHLEEMLRAVGFGHKV